MVGKIQASGKEKGVRLLLTQNDMIATRVFRRNNADDLRIRGEGLPYSID